MTKKPKRKITLKRICIVLSGILMLAATAIGALAQDNLVNRIFSSDKVENGICDDGENILLDDDCKFDWDETKEGQIFKHMWVIRLALIIAAILLITENVNFPIAVIIIICILVFNGAFGQLGTKTIEKEVIEEEHTTAPSPLMGWLEGIGSFVLPDKPYLGLGILLGGGYLIFRFLTRPRQ
jgi:hypothetical protein